MGCICSEVPQISYYEKLSNEFFKSLEKIETKEWYELFQCQECKQYWRIDIWDKYQTRFVVKLNSIDNWQKLDSSNLIKGLLIKERGGLQEKTCIIKDCKNKRLSGLVYCVDHAYETGIRK